MLEAIIASMIASFLYDNAEFLHIKQQQEKAGYTWVYQPKERDPDKAAIPLIHHDGSQSVIWILKKED